jgi:hypothetical protein
MATTAKKTTSSSTKKASSKATSKAAKKTSHKPGPKDRDYVNKKQEYEVAYESKRKTPAKKFGSKKAS